MKYFITLVILSLASSSLAMSCPEKKSINQIAQEIIKLELSGVHISGQEKSKCLDQKKYPHLLVVYEPSNESFQGKTHSVEGMGDLKIIKIEMIDPEVNLHRVSYELKAKDLSNKNVILKDSLDFFLYIDLRNKQHYGCAGIVTPPTNRALLSFCEVK